MMWQRRPLGRSACLASVFGAMAIVGSTIQSHGVERGSKTAPTDYQVVTRALRTLADQPNVSGGEGALTLLPGKESLSVLVHLAPVSARVSAAAAVSFRRDIRAWTAAVGGRVKHEYKTVLPNVINIRGITLAQKKALEAMPGVSRVEDDRIMHAHLTVSTPMIRALQSQITGAGLSADGSGVRVCIIDTGIDSDHIMYSSRIDTAAGRDFANNDNNPEDDAGHGSNVAGIAVGGTGVSITRCSVSTPIQGVAPNATLIGIKVLDQNGSGSFADVIAGIDYGADQTASGGRCDVMNLSLGGGAFSGNCDSDSAAIAVNNAVANGVVVVASAGNEGNANAMGTPACASGAIAVGAVYDNDFPNCEDSQSSFNWCLNSSCTSTCLDNNISADDLVCFSNHSTTIDVSAPGCNAVSADNAPGGTTFSGQCGTSQAGPHVAGLAALLLSADPGLTPSQVRQFIRDGAIDLGPAGFDTGYGWGRIDAINSLSLLTPCGINADCDDGDPCTTDVCSSESCSNTTISCPINQTCVGGTCVGSGACCSGTSCTIDNPSNCSASGGSYLGDGTTCGSGTAGNPTVYQSSPNVAIPDGGGSGNPATDTINVPDSVNIGDVNVDLTITHTWVGDVTVTVSHLGTTVTVLDRPGVPASTYGCSTDNYSGILLDDQGTGGDIESQCAANLSSPPNYTPNSPLSAFDGMDSAGDWVITIYDSATPDPGTLNTWSLHIDAVGSNPCTAGCTSDPECDDGVFCNGAETCDIPSGTCQAGTAPNCNDGVGCTDDSCNEGTASCDNTSSDANCDDGLFCNGSETCDAVNDCQTGTTVNCNDGVACTDDSCNEGTNSCDNTANDANCDNGLFCDGSETCDAVQDCQAGTAPTCDDGVACTDDSCNTGTDSCDNIANNANCDDGLGCNGAETCDAVNDCQAGTAVNCNDGVGCTADSCNDPSGTCSNTTSDAACDDGLACNGAETCDTVNDCQAGTTVNCDDGVGCTTDACNEPGGTCSNSASDAACDDGLFCTGTETCDAVLDCQAGMAVDCNDGVGCTDDSCNEGTNSCDNTANNANCDNGLFCDGAETCDAGLDCQVGGDPCPGQSCDEGTNTCVSCLTNADCDDGSACNGAETCVGGACQAGTTVNCNDGVACTADACNEPSGTCSNTPDDAACDDGLACNGAETCDALLDCLSGMTVNCDDGVACTVDACNEPGGTCSNSASDAACDDGLFCNGVETCDAVFDCLGGTAVNCNDGVACTDDSCNEGTSSCDNVANDANCDNGLFCDGTETCDAVNDCQVGGDPCPGQSCDEGTDACVSCLTNGDCDDGFACNGAETCVGGNCQAGTAVNCDDGVACTADSCNEPSGTCSNSPNNGACDDGLACNGAETCDAVLDCQAGTAVNCDDGIGCTTDACNEPGGTCSNAADDAACDDGLFCTGAETCDAILDCQAGTAVNCSDGVACTDDSCNEGTSSCDNVANDANCPDDLLFCSGTEFCDAALDCSSTGDPCGAGTTCNETTDNCDSTGPPPGEGYILSRNPDFSTDDRSFFRNETLYMLMWTDQVDFNDISRARWELKDAGGTRIRQPLANLFDGSYTAAFALSGLPSNDTDWTWKGEVKDNSGTRYKPSDFITVLDAPACSINSDCDDGDACTTDVCSGGSCSNTPISCDDGDACTTDSCSGGVCSNAPVNCDDGDACTTDTCDSGTGCSNAPIDCNDGDACTSDTCSGGVCFNDPLPTCCGDTFCDAGEDSCNCPADCGPPPASEANCSDGIDEDCDGSTDCADADCAADPACSTPTGEGYILSLNPDFSTDDRTYSRSDTIYMLVWTDQVDFNDMNRERWELKDPSKNKVREPLTNHFDGTWTASFDLSGLPSNATDWTWKGEAKDSAGNTFKPTDTITVSP